MDQRPASHAPGRPGLWRPASWPQFRSPEAGRADGEGVREAVWHEVETVTLVGPSGRIAGVRILGPVRDLTQVEIARTDGFVLGVHRPVRLSGDIAGTPGITVVGPRGGLAIAQGVIVAARHIHINTDEANAAFLSTADAAEVLRAPARAPELPVGQDALIQV